MGPGNAVHRETRTATPDDVEVLLPLVRAYHEFEGIGTSDSERRRSIMPLLCESGFGRIWTIETPDQVVGYVAVCFGYSIEFGGRDAFLDELYIVEEARSQGLGGRVLEEVKGELAALGVCAVHLEVSRANPAAKRLYSRAGFASRDRFHLMSCKLDVRKS